MLWSSSTAENDSIELRDLREAVIKIWRFAARGRWSGKRDGRRFHVFRVQLSLWPFFHSLQIWHKRSFSLFRRADSGYRVCLNAAPHLTHRHTRQCSAIILRFLFATPRPPLFRHNFLTQFYGTVFLTQLYAETIRFDSIQAAFRTVTVSCEDSTESTREGDHTPLLPVRHIAM